MVHSLLLAQSLCLLLLHLPSPFCQSFSHILQETGLVVPFLLSLREFYCMWIRCPPFKNLVLDRIADAQRETQKKKKWGQLEAWSSHSLLVLLVWAITECVGVCVCISVWRWIVCRYRRWWVKRKDQKIHYFYFGVQRHWRLVAIWIMEMTVGSEQRVAVVVSTSSQQEVSQLGFSVSRVRVPSMPACLPPPDSVEACSSNR